MSAAMTCHRMLLVVVALILLGPVALATAGEDAPNPRILVTGEGSVDLAPDMAILTLSVRREAKTARAALDANSSAMAEVFAAMRAEGVEERDLQTSNFSIRPRYSRPPRNSSGEAQAPRIVGYTVSNSLAVRLRKIEKLGAILDKSVTLGVNEGGNIRFTNAEPATAINKARAAAVKDAMAKASTLAGAAGVKRGRILEISEHSFQPGPMPVMMAEADMGVARAASAVPVAAGENTYRVNVNMSFAIDQ